MEPRRSTSSPPEGDIKKALLEAREEALRSEGERHAAAEEAERQPEKKSRLLPVMFLATVLFGAYVLIAKPAWLTTPPPPPETPVMLEASLRVAMWQQALYVERFRGEHDELPADLEAAGAPDVAGIFYTLVGDDSYILTGSNGSVDLAYRAEDSLEDFVGNSLETIANRGAE